MKNFFKNKKFKYGSLGVVFTAAVVALLVVVNVIVYTLVYSNSWFFDMTGEQVYNVSEQTYAMLDTISPEHNNITIYFLAQEDEMNMVATTGNSSSQTTLWGMKYVHSLARELEERYSFIKCEYIDLEKQPDVIKGIIGEDYYEAASLNKYHIIIDNYTVEREADGSIINGTDGKPLYWHNFRIYNRNSFYAFDYTTSGTSYYVNAFKGDYRYCSAIMSVCNEKIPTAYFISGHGEDIGSYTVGKQDSTYNYAQHLWQLFRDCGFNVKKIDLQHEDFGNEENAVAVIYSPETDYSFNPEVSTNNELGKISAFLEKKGHSLMVYLDYGTQTLPNLESYLESSFGVSYQDAQIKDNGENSIDVNMLHIVGKLQQDTSQTGYKVSAPIADSTKKIVFTNCRPITVTDSSKTSTVVYAPTSSSARYIDKTVSYAEGTPASLATITKLSDSSYVFCAGCSYVTDVVFTDGGFYGNRDLLLSVIDAMSEEEAPVNIEYKIIAGEGLDITKGEAISAMILISAVIPLAVAVAGMIVYVRRRHS